jgi:hypothetical protein
MVLTTGVLLSSAFGAVHAEKTRKFISKIHGSALLVVLIAGFGLLAKAKLAGVYVSVWFWAKMAAWLLFGMLPLVIKKTPDAHKPKLLLLYSVVPVLITYLVLTKAY